MTPDQNRLVKLEQEVAQLRALLQSMAVKSEIDPQFARLLKTYMFSLSSASPASYDQAVNESGSNSYNVAAVFDGFYVTTDNKLIGYYDI